MTQKELNTIFYNKHKKFLEKYFNNYEILVVVGFFKNKSLVLRIIKWFLLRKVIVLFYKRSRKIHNFFAELLTGDDYTKTK